MAQSTTARRSTKRTTEPKRRRRAAIYRRISDDRQGLQVGIERQLTDCERLAARLDCDVVTVYTENDVSASRYSTKVRTEFNKLIAAIKAGEIDIVIIYNSDRFVRQPRELEDLIDLAEKYNFDIEHETGEMDLRTDKGRFMARLFVALGAQESDTISRRVKAAHRHRAEKGLPSGGRRPFAYEDDQITIVPDEAALFRWGVEQIIAGASMRSVTEAFKASGIPPVGGGEWVHPNLRIMLMRDRYAGFRSHGDQRYPAVWKGIITEDELELVRAKLTKAGRKKNEGARKHLLSGLLHCTRCEAPMVANVAMNHGKGRYICNTCHACSVALWETNDLVIAAALAKYDGSTLAAKVKSRAEETKKGPSPAAQREALQAKLDALSVRYLVNEDIEEDEYNAARHALLAKLETLKAKVADEIPANALARLTGGEPLADWWNKDTTTLQMQRDALRLIFVKIDVPPGKRGAHGPPLEDRLKPKWRLL